MTHPSFDTLLEYLEGALSEDERQAVDAHLAGLCPRCSRELARLRKILEAAGSDDSATPPPEVLQRAVAAYRDRRDAGSHRSPGSHRLPVRILAELLFDSRLNLADAPVRGARPSRQVLYSAGDVDIDLQITPEHTSVSERSSEERIPRSENMLSSLVGQVLENEQNTDTAQAFISLEGGQGWLQSAETDDHGQFAFRQVPPGTYDLVFNFERREVAIEGLELGV